MKLFYSKPSFVSILIKMFPGTIVFLLACLLILFSACAGKMSVEEAKQVTVTMSGEAFVPPPRRIDDILSILDQPGHFDSKITKKHRAIADSSPPNTNNANKLYPFYVKRGQAALQIYRFDQALADFRKALIFARRAKINDPYIFNRLGIMELWGGNYKRGVDFLEKTIALEKQCSSYSQLVKAYAMQGDLETAEKTKNEGIKFCNRPDWWYGKNIHTPIMKAVVLEAQGDYEAAEKHWRYRLKNAARMKTKYPAHLIVSRTELATNLIKQNRLLEAEQELRLVIEAAIAHFGKDSEGTGSRIQYLGQLLQKQGRLEDAQKLLEAGMGILQNSDLKPGSYIMRHARILLGDILVDRGKYLEAIQVYELAKENLEKKLYQFEKKFARNPNLILCLLKTDRIDPALKLISAGYKIYQRNFGENHPLTAEILGFRGMAYFHKKNFRQAITDFSKSIPVLLAANIATTGDYSARLRFKHIIETYMDLLSRTHASLLEKELDLNAAAEAFRLADAVRGQAVQSALGASGARVAVENPVLADLVRREQNTDHQIKALQTILNDTLASPEDQRDPAAIESLTAKLHTLGQAHSALLVEIKKLFPKYSDFTNPQPATISTVKKYLQPDEALISIYTTDDHSYVWAIPSDGEIKFFKSNMGIKKIIRLVNLLRKSLDPDPETLGDIPAFDLRQAYRIYNELLKPVESIWQDGTDLIIVAHGPLGQLPFAILPTAEIQLQKDNVLFASYRKVPWLIRKVSITRQPSVSSFITLRSLPQGDPERKAFAGFGDPFFNKTQLAEAKKEQPSKKPGLPGIYEPLQVRGIRITDSGNLDSESITSSNLGMLNRLPDTADEIISIARALDADTEADIFLGKKASEQQVKTMDLSDRRVIAFATHALVPQDLDGLDQPALALCSPKVTGGKEDGLLTLGEILKLKLNADWIVLSACNTGAAEGAGAEAVSGLGRAFFYAGSRAILVSMWPVETSSARQLTSRIFEYQKEDQTLSRAGALRQSILALIDGPGMKDPVSGRIAASYAHPFFWAPFIIVGESNN
jgi:CHAT domain-containing protein/predicted negative regulator of RcsB-dependent stress response